MNLKNDKWTIKDGVLLECNDTSDNLVIPEGVESIDINIKWPNIVYKTVTFPLTMQNGYFNNLECEVIVCYKHYVISQNEFRASNDYELDFPSLCLVGRDLNIVIKGIKGTKDEDNVEIYFYRKEFNKDEIEKTADSILGNFPIHIIVESDISLDHKNDLINLKRENIFVHLYQKSDYLIIDGVLIAYYGESQEAFIPDGVKEIATEAFKGKYMKKVFFPNSLKRIEDYAFWESDIISAAIPDSVEYIGTYAFCTAKLGECDVQKLSVGPKTRFGSNPPFSINELTVRTSSKTEFLLFLNGMKPKTSPVNKINQINISGFLLSDDVISKARSFGFIKSIAATFEGREILKYHFYSSSKTPTQYSRQEEIAINSTTLDGMFLLPSACSDIKYLYYDNRDGVGLKSFINYLRQNNLPLHNLSMIFVIGRSVSFWQKECIRFLLGNGKLKFENIPEFDERTLKSLEEKKVLPEAEKEHEDEDIESLINQIINFTSDFSPEDKALVMNKINALIDKYNSDLDNIGPSLDLNYDVILHESIMSPEILKVNLLSAFEGILANMNMNKASQKLKAEIIEYEKILQNSFVDIPENTETLENKIRFIIAVSRKMQNNVFLDELRELLSRSKEEITHQSILYLLEEITMHHTDVNIAFPLEIDTLLAKVQKEYSVYNLFRSPDASPLAEYLMQINDYIGRFDEVHKKDFYEEYYSIVRPSYNLALGSTLTHEEISHELCTNLNPFLDKLASAQKIYIGYKDILDDIENALNRNFSKGFLICELVSEIYDLLKNEIIPEKHRKESNEKVLDILQTWQANVQNPYYEFPKKEDYFLSSPKEEVTDPVLRFQIAILSELQGVKMITEIIYNFKIDTQKRKLKKR